MKLLLNVLFGAIAIASILSCSKEENTGNACATPNLIIGEKAALNDLIFEVDKNAFPLTWNFDNLKSTLPLTNASITGFYTDVITGFALHNFSTTELIALKSLPWITNIEPAQRISISQTCNPAPVNQDSEVVPENLRITGFKEGTGKRAWIIDTGVDMDHIDLNVNQELSRNFTENSLLNDLGIFQDNDIEDGNGHGTHVAGIIGAKKNQTGVIGVAYGAEIVAIKVLTDAGEGSSIDLLQALDYVFRTAKAGQVVNLSLGGNASDLIDEAVQNLGRKGILVSIAAGNDSESANNTSPARANGNNIYTVSAIGNNYRYANFSNFGNPPIDYAEPGIAIFSTYKNGQYATLSGTSMAAPHLAAILLINGTAVQTVGIATNDPDGNADKIGGF
jgi:hypothetical protein